MKILITGGTGLLGNFLAEDLIKQGHSLVMYHRRDNPSGPLQNHPSVSWIQGSLFDMAALEEALDCCDAILHVAGMVAFAPHQYAEMNRVNVEATKLLVDIAKDFQVNRFVHISSVSAIGRPKHQTDITESALWEEDTKVSEYAKTKHLGEREVWRGIEEGLAANIINPSIVFSPGEEVRSSLRLLDRAHKGQRFYFPGSFNYVDIRDVAQLVKVLLETDAVGERYIASAGTISYESFFQQCAEILSQPAPTRKIPLSLLQTLAPIEEWRARLFRAQPILTRDMVASLRSSITYNGQKASDFAGFQYRNLSDSIRWVFDSFSGN